MELWDEVLMSYVSQMEAVILLQQLQHHIAQYSAILKFHRLLCKHLPSLAPSKWAIFLSSKQGFQFRSFKTLFCFGTDWLWNFIPQIAPDTLEIHSLNRGAYLQSRWTPTPSKAQKPQPKWTSFKNTRSLVKFLDRQKQVAFTYNKSNKLQLPCQSCLSTCFQVSHLKPVSHSRSPHRRHPLSDPSATLKATQLTP